MNNNIDRLTRNRTQKSRKLLVDMSTFRKLHKGGKDEVAYNLLRGFSVLGYSDRIICTARHELIDIIHSIDENYKVIPIRRFQFEGRIGNLLCGLTSIIYGLKLKRIIKKTGCNNVLYTNKLSPLIKQPVKTWLIPHDIQLFNRLEASHGLKLYTRAYTLLTRMNFFLVDHIVAISRFDMEEMIRYMPEFRGKIVQIYNPIRFKTVTQNKYKRNITALNIQHDHKNTLTLVKAYARIADKINENLVLVGRKELKPWEEKGINTVIMENNLESRVVFTGFVSEEELRSIISTTRIYVNPSLYEGFGMAAVEMMESKIPTIVARNTAQPEVTLGLCKYYEPATNDKALGDAILNEIENPTSEQRLINISEAVREKYDYRTIAHEYWTIIMGEG